MASGALSAGLAACSPETHPPPVEEPAKHRPDDPSTSSHHQPGVTSVPPAAAALAALDLTAIHRDKLQRLLRLLTRRIQRPQLRAATADALTVTVAVGAGLSHSRLGLSELCPSRLTAMPRFPNDALDRSWSHGDLLVQVCAARPDVARAGLQRVLDGTDALVQRRWAIEGSGPRTT